MDRTQALIEANALEVEIEHLYREIDKKRRQIRRLMEFVRTHDPR